MRLLFTLALIFNIAFAQTAVNFGSVGGAAFVESPAGRWGDDGYGVADVSIAASTDGWIEAEYQGNDNKNTFLALDNNNTADGVGNQLFILYIDASTGNYVSMESGYNQFLNSGVAAATNDKYRLRRGSGQVWAEYFRSGSWINLRGTSPALPFPTANTALLYMKGGAAYNLGSVYLLNPKHLTVVTTYYAYYVSSTGNDSNDGLTTGTAWQTLTKVNAMFAGMNSGDSILFKRGDVFSGFLNVGVSGNSTKPFFVGAYSTGAKPVITGLSDITSWTSIGSNKWEKTLSTFPKRWLNMLLFNGAIQPMGRLPRVDLGERSYWPISDTIDIDSSRWINSNCIIESDSIATVPSMVGGEIVHRSQQWVHDRYRISAQTSNTLTLAALAYTDDNIMAAIPGVNYKPLIGHGFFFQNHPNTLTQTGDWSYDSATKKITLFIAGGINPSAHNIQATVLDTLVKISNKTYVTFSNIEFKGANEHGISLANMINHIRLDSCKISYIGINGIRVNQETYENVHHITLDSTEIVNVLNNGVDAFESQNWLIKKCYIHNIAKIHGAGMSNDGAYVGIYKVGSNSVVEYNRLDSIGYNAIWFVGPADTIRYNHVSNYVLTKADGGGIYAYGKGDVVYGNNRGRRYVYKNVVHDGKGDDFGLGRDHTNPHNQQVHGIYMDTQSDSVTIIENIIFNNSHSNIWLGSATNIVVRNNIAFNSVTASIKVTNGEGENENIIIKNNIFFESDSGSLSASLNISNGSLAEVTMDSNYYCRPMWEPTNIDSVAGYSASPFRWPTYTDGGTFERNNRYFSLDKWQSRTGKDANSRKTYRTIKDSSYIKFIFNAGTASPKAMDNFYHDQAGTLYDDNISLAAWSGIPLLNPTGSTVNGQRNWDIYDDYDSAFANTEVWSRASDGKHRYKNNIEYPYGTLTYNGVNGAFGNLIPRQMSVVKNLHDMGYKGKNINIGIIDAGFSEYTGLSFAGGLGSYLTEPPSGTVTQHGRKLASIIGEKPNGYNGLVKPNGIVGLAYEAKLYALPSNMVSGIECVQWCIDTHSDNNDTNDIHIINIASVSMVDAAYTSKIQEAIRKGIIVVIAAGNGSPYPRIPITYPASIPGVIAVTGKMGGSIFRDKDSAIFGNVLPSTATGKSKSIDFSIPSWINVSDNSYSRGWTVDVGSSEASAIMTGYIACEMSYMRDRYGIRLTPTQMLKKIADNSTNPNWGGKYFDANSLITTNRVTFRLDTSAVVSAGVFRADSVLVRTLFSNVRYNKGEHLIEWDGTMDIKTDSAYTGNYHIEVLTNNVAYEWLGVIGNTSDEKSGTSVHHNPLYGIFPDMTFSKNRGYIPLEYTEFWNNQLMFDTASPNRKIHIFDSTGRPLTAASILVATDDTTVYWAGGDSRNINKTFIFGTNISDNDTTVFSSGVSATMAFNGVYPSVIDYANAVNTNISGMAVQKHGDYLFASHAGLNELHVMDKRTGALVQNISITGPQRLATDSLGFLWMVKGGAAPIFFSSTPYLSDPTYDKDKAHDYDPNTFYNSQVTGDNWLGIDMGIAKVCSTLIVRGRNGYEGFNVFTGVVVQGSNTDEISGFTTLYTFDHQPPDGEWDTIVYTNTTPYRYYRMFNDAANGHALIASEMRFYLLDSLNLNTVEKYTVNSGGTITTTGIVLDNLVKPLAVAVSPDNLTVVVCDGGISQQLKGYDNADGDSAWTYGTAGGYATEPDIRPDKFYFAKPHHYPLFELSFVAFQPDGSFWVGDPGNCRAMHLKANRDFINQIINTGAAYASHLNPTNINKAYLDYIEYAIDYTKPFNARSGAWTQVKNWGWPVNEYYDDNFIRLRDVVTLSNGRTYALQINEYESGYEIVELPATGNMRFTGVLTADQSYNLQPDGSLWRVKGIGIDSIAYWIKQPLTGFDGSHNPIYSSTLDTVARTPRTASTDPAPALLSKMGAGQITSSNIVLSFNPNGPTSGTGLGYRLGLIQKYDSTYLAKTSYITHPTYAGDYPNDGAFDVGNDVSLYAGGFAQALDRNIFWNHHGEFWKGGQTNEYQHYYDNGLMVGRYGSNFQDAVGEAAAKYAGNSLSGTWVKNVAGDYYMINNDEGIHGGAHLWKISRLNTIAVQSYPVKLAYPVVPLAVNYTKPLQGIPYNDTLVSGQVSTMTWTDTMRVITSHFSYDRRNPDIYAYAGSDVDVTRSPQTFSLDLGTTGTADASWSLTFDMLYQSAATFIQDSGQCFVDILDQKDSVILRFNRTSDLGTNLVFLVNSDTLLFATGGGGGGGLVEQANTFMSRYQGLTVSASSGGMIVTYNGVSKTVARFDPLSTILNPKKLRIKFRHGVNPIINNGYGVALSDLKLIHN